MPRPVSWKMGGVAVVLLLTGLGVFFTLSPSPPQGLDDRTQWLAQGPTLPPFFLPSTHGTLAPDQLQKQWTLLLFGYTHCPDVCPTDLGVLASVVQQRRRENRPVPQVIFISVDPSRDSLPLLARYLGAFDAAFIGAQADDKQLKPFTQTLGVYAVRHTDERDAAGNYPVDHSTAFYLFNPSGALQASFQTPQNPVGLAQQLQRVMANP